jgi:hypothetical protein
MSKVFEGFDTLKCVAGGAETAEDVAGVLEDIAANLRAMAKDGIEIDLENISEGHLIYRTNNRELAKTYGFYELDEEGEPIGVDEFEFNPATGKNDIPVKAIFPVQ